MLKNKQKKNKKVGRTEKQTADLIGQDGSKTNRSSVNMGSAMLKTRTCFEAVWLQGVLGMWL